MSYLIDNENPLYVPNESIVERSDKNFSINDLLKTWLYPCSICGKRRHDFYLTDVIHEAQHSHMTLYFSWDGYPTNGKSWSEIIHACRITGYDDAKFSIKNIIFPDPNDSTLEVLRQWYLEHTNSIGILEEISTGDVTKWWMGASETLKDILNTQGASGNVLFINSPVYNQFPMSIRVLTRYRVTSRRRWNIVTNNIYEKRSYPDYKHDTNKFMLIRIGSISPVMLPNEDTKEGLFVKQILKDYVDMKTKWRIKGLKENFGIRTSQARKQAANEAIKENTVVNQEKRLITAEEWRKTHNL